MSNPQEPQRYSFGNSNIVVELCKDDNGKYVKYEDAQAWARDNLTFNNTFDCTRIREEPEDKRCGTCRNCHVVENVPYYGECVAKLPWAVRGTVHWRVGRNDGVVCDAWKARIKDARD